MTMDDKGNPMNNVTGTPAPYSQPTFDLLEEASQPTQSARTRTPPRARNTNRPHGHIVHLKDLPGPLSMHRLVLEGILVRLDDTQAYTTRDAGTLAGRTAIIRELLPPGIPACGRTAAWVWAGGDFPQVLDVLSRSHFRAPVAGRRIHTLSRRVPSEQLTALGDLQLTTPARTACDLALFPYDEIIRQQLHETMVTVMQQCHVDVRDCLKILDGCPHLHTARQARRVIGDFACIA
ncbi:hypothetical protein [Bifidobacterium cuniculi]|uniref:AbiEi antitoxin C-terminal domain-containing protein n=1 Tax=Bifidobacterium cuniculi TaxID=1688 RepID=A0A087AZQ1_9BIFI|nr:hypothetical protein [Bifidobacterium cuniculi]KFI64251.1 hypothetical protein BCUN_2116 [Bifidobacterium cuniculi]